jgi:signal transduction histidine kinase/ActR/RegA family two-component response regulator
MLSAVLHPPVETQVNPEVLQKLLEFSEAILKGDYSKRVVTDFGDDTITQISSNLNQFADQMLLDPGRVNYNSDEIVGSFIEVISSYTNLDFKHKLHVSDSGNIWDAIATGINMLGDELEHSTASRQELEREQQNLKEAKEQAEAANMAKSLFLANMSHEIRTPLNGILGITQIMQQDDVSDEFRSYLDMIHTSGKNLAKLINDILDFSKIESGKMELEQARFNLHKLIQSDMEQHRVLAEQKGLSFICNISDSVPVEVLGDSIRITQILTNIISNAIKFTEQGSITANFSAIETAQHDVVIQCSIRDTGIGIRNEVREKIFQSFTQADNSVTRKFGGTGLGLSIAKRLVEMMEGEISVHSAEDRATGSGTTFNFTIRLRLPERKIMNGDLKKKHQFQFLKQFHILIVDDNPINLFVARKMVEKFGATVTTAVNGMEGIQAVQKNNFDVILMDIQMPVLDGHEATRSIRTQFHFNNPIIALSANAFPEDVRKSLDAGMNAHVQKPYTEEHLFQIINKSLEESYSLPKAFLTN